ncbi:uncharacterized protein LOC133829662 [Humulus lupulus]|uniref:uncharacterized protein LOC133829662 n=1 Tax=Humulus lupulus TaxID=3486 RepID=UPI002B40B55C|nr:uncharacterized protein LOC133829662 [Humulus lupulus]
MAITNSQTKSQQMGSHCHTKEKVCEICGGHNPHSEFLLVTCSVCNTTCEHVYCMRRKVKHKVPEDWVCESCLNSDDSILMESGETDALETSSFQEDEVVTMAMSTEQFSALQQKPVKTGKVKFNSHEQAIKRSSEILGKRLSTFKESKDINPLDDDYPFPENSDEEMDDVEGFDNDENMSDDEVIEDYVAGRGPTLMRKVFKARSEGIRTPIVFNEFGQVIGPARTRFVSTLGSIVRRTVNIKHDSWAKVPTFEKNKLWHIVEETFEIDPKARKKILQAGGRYWRNFKTNLTNRWIEKHRYTKPHRLMHPPRGYISVIRKVDWDNFVKVRLSPEWAEKRKKMQAVRAKLPHNHNMSRGGYVSKEEQLMKESDGQISEFDRAELWKLGRQNKRELSGEEASAEANIDHYKKVKHEVPEDWVCESSPTVSDLILRESGEKDVLVTSSFQEDEAVTRAMSNEQFSILQQMPAETDKTKFKSPEQVNKPSSGIMGTGLSTFKESKDINPLDDDYSFPEDVDEETNDAEGFDNDDNMSGDEEIEEYVAGRGPTLMHEVFKARSEGIRTPIEFNEFGQVIGPARTRFASTLGSIVRRSINIKHDSWAKVPTSEKNKLWHIVEETFEIDPKARKKILQTGGRYWRNFKTNLTNCWIEKHRYTKPHRLRHPPKGYISVITKIDWDNFVKVRLSPEWAEKRKKMQAVRAKLTHNHNMSRGGYISKEEQLMKERDDQISEFDQAELWSLGQTNKKGELSGEATSVKVNIDHFQKVKHEVPEDWVCESCPSGNDSILMESGEKDVLVTSSFQEDEAVTRAMNNEQFSVLQQKTAETGGVKFDSSKQVIEPSSGITGTRLSTFKESKDINPLDDDCPFPEDGDEEMDDPERFDNDDNMSGDEEVENYVAGRGPTLMREVFKARSEGIRTPIVFNEFGQVIGPARTRFASTLGSIVRRTINIKHDSWAKVPTSEKNKLWHIVEETFEIDPKARKKILQTGGRYWRNFKTNLTNCWIEKHRYTKPHRLRHPPKGYMSVIKKIDWDNFVKVRLSPEWAEKRKKMQAVRAKLPHNHNMSRGGYISKEEQLMKENDGQITEIDRAELWTLGRMNKKGELTGEAASVKANIDHYRQLQTEGKWKPQGSNDLLTMALGTPERRGFVRGMGVGVTPTQFFDTPTPTSRKVKAKEISNNAQVDALRREFEEKLRQQEEFFRQQQEEFLRRQEAMMKAFMESARGSSHVGGSSHASTPEFDTTYSSCVPTPPQPAGVTSLHPD